MAIINRIGRPYAGINYSGLLSVFGLNTSYQLGTGDNVNRLAPDVVSNKKWLAISGGALHSVGIDTDGYLFGCGSNGNGRLGLGSEVSSVSTMTQIGTDKWIAVSCGANHTVAIRSDGYLFVTGYNGFGQLGLNDLVDRYTLTQVGTSTWISIACGHSHTLGVMSSGYPYAWGANSAGQCGQNNTTARILVPSSMAGYTANIVRAGDNHSMVVVGTGVGAIVFACGSNNWGQLGFVDTANRLRLSETSNTSGAISLAGGGAHTLVVRSDGSLWGSGWNGYGQLGLGSTLSVNTFTRIGSGLYAKASCGSGHSVVIGSDNKIRSAGLGRYGALGLGDANDKNEFTIINDASCVSVSCGSNSSFAIAA